MEQKMVWLWFSWILVAYLIGGIPFGFLIGKLRGVDVRTVGSKNIGATNVFRTAGKKWGLLAFACDVLKGLIPVLLAKHFASSAESSLPLAVGIACVTGHMLTPYIKNEQGRRFHGGKGVATAFGMLLGLIPALVGVAFALFSLTFACSNFISLGSCFAATFLAVAIWFPWLGVAGAGDLPQCILVTLIALFIVWKHRSNIVRLIHGNENKIYLFKKKPAVAALAAAVIGISSTVAEAAIENTITEYRDGIPYVESGYGLLRNYYCSGKLSCIHSAMGGLADIFYVGKGDYSWKMMNLVQGGPVVTTYVRHFRPVLLVDNEPYDLTFSKTYHYPFGYRSECAVAGVKVCHELVLDKNVMFRRVRVLENPKKRSVRLRIDQSGGGLAGGARWDFDVASGRIFGECPTAKGETTVTNFVEIGMPVKTVMPINDRPLDFLTFKRDWMKGRNRNHFYLDTAAGADELIAYLAFNRAPNEDFSSARIDRVYAQFEREHAGDARFVTAVPELGGFLSYALPIARSLEIGDTGAFRASQTYWVWAWDAMVHAGVLSMLGRSAEVKRMLGFFTRTADPEQFFRFAYNTECTDSLYSFANKNELATNSGKAFHLLYVLLLHQYWCVTGDDAMKQKCLPLARKIMVRYLEGVKRGGRLLPFEGAFYPDYPSALGISTSDCSMASAGIYYQALRAFEELTGERLTDSAKVKAEIERLMWDDQKGLWADSVDGKTLERRKVFTLWGPFWVSPFAGELGTAPWTQTAANLFAEFDNGCFLQMVNLHSERYFGDGNQLCAYVPPTDRFYWNAMNLGGRLAALAEFDHVVGSHARVATFPEGQTSDMRNLDPATASDNLGVKQFFTVKGWLSDAVDLNLGLVAHPNGISLRPIGDGRPFEIRNMTFRGKLLTIRRTGRGTSAAYVLNGQPLKEGFVGWDLLKKANGNLLEITMSSSSK